MPGPRMGPRPPDFNEDLVRKAPTFVKWEKLEPGERLTYACRQYVKGGVDDEERLMRRIMIARRNNIKDHNMLKRARAAEAVKRGVIPVPVQGLERKDPTKMQPSDGMITKDGVIMNEGESTIGNDDNNDDSQMEIPIPIPPLSPPSPSNPSGTKRRRVAGTLLLTDDEILAEMDMPAVEATRSWRRWLELPHGTLFRYNQTYVKGAASHDWLLKKNIWRRMRYRRENQMKVREMANEEDGTDIWPAWKTDMMHNDAAVKAEADVEGKEEECLVSKAVADAAAAAAAQVAFEPGIDADAVAALGADDPIVSSALDAAAKLAAVAVADAPTAAALEEHVLVTPTLKLEGNAMAVSTAELEDNVMAAATAELEGNIIAAATVGIEEDAPTAELYGNAMAAAAHDATAGREENAPMEELYGNAMAATAGLEEDNPTAELYGNPMAAAAAAEIDMAASETNLTSTAQLEENAVDDDPERVEVTIML